MIEQYCWWEGVPELEHPIKVEVSGRGGVFVVILKSTMMSTTGVCRCK